MSSKAIILRVALKSLVVLLGVILLSILTVQTVYDGWNGQPHLNAQPGESSVLEFGVIACYLVYMILTLLRPQQQRWSHRRFTYIYLLSIFALTFVVSSFAFPWLRFFGYIVIFAVVIQAHSLFGRKGSWLIAGVLLSAILFATLFIGNAPINTAPEWTPLQLVMWLIGLIFAHTFIALAIQERTARMENEQLVKDLMEAQAQLRTYAIHAEELATMRERTRVAREVHDTLAQGFVAIKMHLEASHAVFHDRPALALQHVEQARQLAGSHLREARTSILELRTEGLNGQSLPTALTALAATSHACHVSFSATTAIHTTAMIELALYRVAQESVNNAIHHGHASQIELELSCEANTLCLTITDDGRGFEPLHDGERKGCFGIVGMQERMRLLAGELDIISSPGAGTQVVATIPIG